jgi:hypothetical protein
LRAWIAVVSLEHVKGATAGGFIQANHGREAPMKRLARGDRVIFYSPHEGMRSGAPVQSFTAIGEVMDANPYRAHQTPEFEPCRRKVRYLDAKPALIGPLLDRLSFSKGGRNWGQTMRRGFFLISEEDHAVIAVAMGVEPVGLAI